MFMSFSIINLNIQIIAYDECRTTLQEKSNPYEVPMEMGIYKQLESPLDITTSTIIKRIVANHEAYQVIS